jgi:hypothetical protein
MAPKIARIRAVFQGDELFMTLATYYRQNHYHPVFALRNSLSLLLQIPFFIAAYSYLTHLDLLSHTAFLFIPDLGAPDALLSIDTLAINVLPILMMLINGISGMVYSRALPFSQKLPIYGVSLIFLVLLYNSPSGLVICWIMNNIFSLIKNCVQKIKLPAPRSDPIAPYTSRSVFIYSTLTLFLLSGLVIPLALISASVQEFSFIETYRSPFPFIYHAALQSAGVFIFWLSCVYFLCLKNQKYWGALIMFLLCVFALPNAFCFFGKCTFLSETLVLENPETLMVSFIIKALEQLDKKLTIV